MTTTAFTPQDVATLAELVRPFLPAGMTPETAVGVAVHEARADDESRFQRVFYGDVKYSRALRGALAGTYDEFRAEAAR